MNAGEGIDDDMLGRSRVSQGRRAARRAGQNDATSLLSASAFYGVHIINICGNIVKYH